MVLRRGCLASVPGLGAVQYTVGGSRRAGHGQGFVMASWARVRVWALCWGARLLRAPHTHAHTHIMYCWHVQYVSMIRL